MAGDAVRLQSEERRGATSIAAIVAILAGRPKREPPREANPTCDGRIAPFGLLGQRTSFASRPRCSNITSAARLLLILPRSVQAQAPTGIPNAEVVVTRKTCVGIEAFAARAALAAVRVAVDLGMGAGQLSGREKFARRFVVA